MKKSPFSGLKQAISLIETKIFSQSVKNKRIVSLRFEQNVLFSMRSSVGYTLDFASCPDKNFHCNINKSNRSNQVKFYKHSMFCMCVLTACLFTVHRKNRRKLRRRVSLLNLRNRRYVNCVILLFHLLFSPFLISDAVSFVLVYLLVCDYYLNIHLTNSFLHFLAFVQIT